MRRAVAATLVVAAVVMAISAAPALARTTRIPLRITAPSPANATVAGFRLKLVRAASAREALARAAAGLPKDVTVYAVLARQARSDRVNGALVVVNRAEAVAADAVARPAARTVTVNLRLPAVPRGYRLRVTLRQSANVLDTHHTFLCSRYFRTSDLSNGLRLAGPRLPGITTATVIQSACASARGMTPYPTEGEFRAALNARSGAIAFVSSSLGPNEVDGTASFNYPVQAFGVLADSAHSFTGCGFGSGTCTISSTPGHTNDYALFTLAGSPAPRGAQLPFALAVAPQVSPGLPFQFFGMNAAGSRFGPLLTTGP